MGGYHTGSNYKSSFTFIVYSGSVTTFMQINLRANYPPVRNPAQCGSAITSFDLYMGFKCLL